MGGLDNEWRFNHKIDYIYALRYVNCCHEFIHNNNNNKF